MYTCVQSWKQWTLSVITTSALWQLMHEGTWGTSPGLVHELPQSDSSDNREGILFSWSHIYYAHLTSARFKHLVLCVSWITFEHFSRYWITSVDILIKRNENDISMDLYHKPTDNQRSLPFTSSDPNHCKRNIPFCLGRRIFTIAENNAEKLKNL